MGWFKKLKKKVKDVAKDPLKELASDVEDAIVKPLEPLIEDVDVESLLDFEDPEAGFDALVDAGVNAWEKGGGDFADLQNSIETIQEDNPDFSVGDIFDPEKLGNISEDIYKETLQVTGNTEENFKKILGDELGGYLYETQQTGGFISPHSLDDFQQGGSEDLFGEDGALVDNLNEEIDLAMGGDGTGSGAAGGATSDAAQTQLDFSRRALGLLRDDLAPFKDIMSDKQISDLGNLATRQDAQTSFLDDNALLDKIRSDVTGASFRGDQGESLDIFDNTAPSQGGQTTNRRTGGVKGEKSPEEMFTSSGKNTSIPTGASTQDIISKVFLGAGNDLINQQINRQLPMLSTGQNSAAKVATGSTNLLTGAGNSAAAGTIGAANQKAGNTQNLIGLIATLFSDERLKSNIVKTGEHNGLNVYQWDWNEKGAELGLHGSDSGHIAQEVQLVYPKLVSTSPEGYLMVNYGTDRTVN